MNISQVVYTFPGWWTFGLYPLWCYHRWNFHEDSYSNLFEEIWFDSGKILKSEISWTYGKCKFNFLRNYQKNLSKWLNFSPTMMSNECSSCSILSKILGIARLFNVSNSDGCVVILNWGFFVCFFKFPWWLITLTIFPWALW